MAKVNASAELASMHIYMMILGFTPDEIVDMMTSNFAQSIIDKLSTDIFTDTEVSFPGKIIGDNLAELSESVEKGDIESFNEYENAKSFKKIYEGAQELKQLAKMLGVNQKTSANMQEVYKFLSNFDKIIFARENIIFGNDIGKYRKGLSEKNTSGSETEEYSEILSKVVSKIIEESDGRYTEEDADIILAKLKSFENVDVEYLHSDGTIKNKTVSLIGGNFDFRYYILNTPFNDDYRNKAKEYLNLIKNTFNILDIIDEVPHFKEMINAVKLNHQLMTFASNSYNGIFNVLIDYSRNYGYNISHKTKQDKDDPTITIKGNDSVKHLYGVKGLPIVIGDAQFERIRLWADNKQKEAWLRESKHTKNISFSKETIKELMNRAGVKNLSLYNNDKAIRMNSSDNSYLADIDSFADDFSIDLHDSVGIANYKLLVEQVLIKILGNSESSFSNLLKVSNTTNLHGIRSALITPSFNMSEKNIPAVAEKAIKLTQEFNKLDLKTANEFRLPPGMKWSQLLFVYNTLVNNEKYGPKRITPMLEDYIGDPTSAAADFRDYMYRADKGEFNIFAPDTDSIDGRNKTETEIYAEADLNFAKEILHSAYHTKGFTK